MKMTAVTVTATVPATRMVTTGVITEVITEVTTEVIIVNAGITMTRNQKATESQTATRSPVVMRIGLRNG